MVSEITKGHGSMHWQLADEDSTYFLKAHLRDHRLDTLVPTLEVVRRHGISTPRILHAQRDVDHDAVNAIVVMDWVNGADLGVALADLSSEEIERVGLSIGSNLADLHSIRLPGFSGSVGDFEQSKAWEPLADFAKLELILFRREPRLADPLCAAYLGALDRTPDAIGDRVFVAVALELV